MEHKILYLHGLGGYGQNLTARALREKFAAIQFEGDHTVQVSTPTYNPEDANAWRYFAASVSQYSLVLGSSLGGYHALKLAEQSGGHKVVVVNPCFEPARLLVRHVGHPVPHYDSGMGPEEFTQDMLDEFVPVQRSRAPVYWIAGKQDHLIPESEQAEFARKIGAQYTAEDFGHRLEPSVNIVNKMSDWLGLKQIAGGTQ